jgi:hypothetical protein
VHVVDGSIEVIRVKVVVGESDESGRAVVGKVNEDLGLGVRFDDLAIAALDRGLVARDDGEEVLRGDVVALVVDLAAAVNVLSVGLVEQLAWERVIGVGGHIVVGEDDDVALRDPVLLKDLVRVADVSLVAIVPVTVRACNKHGPVVYGLHATEQQGCSEGDVLQHIQDLYIIIIYNINLTL